MRDSQAVEDVKKDINRIKKLFASPDGKQAYEFLEREFSDRNSFVPGDSHSTAFNEGQRSVMLFIKDTLETDYEK